MDTLKEWEDYKIALEVKAAWGYYYGRICPVCLGSKEVYVPPDRIAGQPEEWAPCWHCNGWGVLDEDGERIPPIPPAPVEYEEVPF